MNVAEWHPYRDSRFPARLTCVRCGRTLDGPPIGWWKRYTPETRTQALCPAYVAKAGLAATPVASLSDRLLAAACDRSQERCLRVVIGDAECALTDSRSVCAVCRAAAWRRVTEGLSAEKAVVDARAERERLRVDRDAWQARALAAETALSAEVPAAYLF